MLTYKDAKYYRDVTEAVRFYKTPHYQIMVPFVFGRDQIDDETFKDVPVWLEAALDLEDVVFRMRKHHDGISQHQTVESYLMLPFSHFLHNGEKITHYYPDHQVPKDPFELWFARFRDVTFFGVRNLSTQSLKAPTRS